MTVLPPIQRKNFMQQQKQRQIMGQQAIKKQDFPFSVSDIFVDTSVFIPLVITSLLVLVFHITLAYNMFNTSDYEIQPSSVVLPIACLVIISYALSICYFYSSGGFDTNRTFYCIMVLPLIITTFAYIFYAYAIQSSILYIYIMISLVIVMILTIIATISLFATDERANSNMFLYMLMSP